MNIMTQPSAEPEIQSAPRTGAQLVVDTLDALGVKCVFGYPGGAIMPVYDAIAHGKTRHILVRHEQAAAFAADSYGRLPGRAGVCLATSGPGATNLITGIANAYLDSVPMVAITGQVAQPMMGTDAFQETDIFGMTMPIVKHSVIVRDPADIPVALAEAFAIAESGRPGPVLVDLPKDVQQAVCENPAKWRGQADVLQAPSPAAIAEADAVLIEWDLSRAPPSPCSTWAAGSRATMPAVWSAASLRRAASRQSRPCRGWAFCRPNILRCWACWACTAIERRTWRSRKATC